jgi:LAS superfamily LD-carboxypeptidase LdcB
VLVGTVVGPAVPVLPAPRAMGPLPASRFGNGRLPAGRLDGIGHGEKLAAPAARHFRRMVAAARAAGVPLPVLNGYRSYGEQVAQQARADGAPVAAPGTSPHGWGLSADLDVSDPHTSAWLQENAARYGFFADLPADPGHWTYRPA